MCSVRSASNPGVSRLSSKATESSATSVSVRSRQDLSRRLATDFGSEKVAAERVPVNELLGWKDIPDNAESQFIGQPACDGNRCSGHEADCLQPWLTGLCGLQLGQCRMLDTHAGEVEGFNVGAGVLGHTLKPDGTVVCETGATLCEGHPASAAGFVELKKKWALLGDGLGQLLAYMLDNMDQVPHRQFITGVFTDLETATLVRLSRPDDFAERRALYRAGCPPASYMDMRLRELLASLKWYNVKYSVVGTTDVGIPACWWIQRWYSQPGSVLGVVPQSVWTDTSGVAADVSPTSLMGHGASASVYSCETKDDRDTWTSQLKMRYNKQAGQDSEDALAAKQSGVEMVVSHYRGAQCVLKVHTNAADAHLEFTVLRSIEGKIKRLGLQGILLHHVPRAVALMAPAGRDAGADSVLMDPVCKQQYIDTAARFFGALKGLIAVHVSRHVHRDVSLANVAVSEAGVGMLLDMGFAVRPSVALPYCGCVMEASQSVLRQRCVSEEVTVVFRDDYESMFKCLILLNWTELRRAMRGYSEPADLVQLWEQVLADGLLGQQLQWFLRYAATLRRSVQAAESELVADEQPITTLWNIISRLEGVPLVTKGIALPTQTDQRAAVRDDSVTKNKKRKLGNPVDNR